MSLKKGMSNAEVIKICRKKPEFEQTFIKGIMADDLEQIVEILKRDGTLVQLLKQGNIGDGVQTLNIKIFYNGK